jgi:translation elongation factor EF-Ts
VPGAGLGGCSKALREADGDYDKAREIAERIANEPKAL